MKILMVGLGRIGRVFAEVILQTDESIELTALSRRRRKGHTELLNNPNFRHITAMPSPSVLQRFDGFVIASPSDTHYSYLQQLIKFSKPIFCEKPVDLSVQKIRQVRDAALRHRAPILVGFNRRYDPQVTALKQNIDEGYVGNLHILRLTSRDPAPPPLSFARQSGGLFLDMVIHDFDMMRFLTNSEPTSIYTKASLRVAKSFSQIGDVDTAVSVVRMEDGTLVTIDTSRKAVYGYDQRIEVFGSKGMLQMNNQRHDQIVKADSGGTHQAPYKDFFMDRYLDSYRIEMQHFITVLKQPDTMVKVSIEDALVATQVALCAEKSRKTGKEIQVKKS